MCQVRFDRRQPSPGVLEEVWTLPAGDRMQGILEKLVCLSLVRLAENEAYFNGLTFRRKGDQLRIYLVLTREGEKTEHELRLERGPF